ncbi:hypothetical protein AAFH68_17690 [Flavobacterium sp. CGRL1]
MVVTVGWFLYSENVVYKKLEDKIAQEKTKILRVSKLFSNVYKTESLARQTIQTNSEKDFKSYLIETDSLKARIDTLKQIVTTEYQKTLLDSVTYLLSEKTENIRQLKNHKKTKPKMKSLSIMLLMRLQKWNLIFENWSFRILPKIQMS